MEDKTKSTNPEEGLELQIQDIIDAMNAGHHNKANKLLDKLPDGVEEKPVLVEQNNELWEKQKEDKVKKVKPESPKKEKPKVEPKAPSPESIIAKMEGIIQDLAELETINRAKSKNYRFIFFTRRRLEVIILNFKKGTR